MHCPHCGHLDNKVMDSRLSKDGKVIRRRRACGECDWRFTTYERVEEFVPLVIKRNGNRAAFDRQKVIQGMMRACEKRNVSAETIENLGRELELLLQEEGKREVATTWIGEWVMQKLRAIDEVAYVRFASVYRQFRDIDEFMAELKGLLDSRTHAEVAIVPEGVPGVLRGFGEKSPPRGSRLPPTGGQER
jgi:transcriptional repressor NrdR